MRRETVNVLLTDDHSVVRAGTRQMLEEDDSITVVGEAADGSEAVALAEQLQPDVVLLDMALPVLNGIQATEQIRRRPNAPSVVLLSAYDDHDYVIAAIGGRPPTVQRSPSRKRCSGQSTATIPRSWRVSRSIGGDERASDSSALSRA